MSKLKNSFGFSESLLNIIKNINETNAQFSREMGDLNIAKKREEETRQGFLKAKKNTEDLQKELNPQPPLIDKQKRLVNSHEENSNIINELEIKPLNKLIKTTNDKLIEANGAYPFNASSIAPLLVVLKSILNHLSASPSLRKLMKEETGIEYDNVESFINFIQILGEELELVEYRTKGAVRKKKQATTTPKGKSQDEEEEDEGPAYPKASGPDQEHIMTQLKGAVDAGGRHIDTSQGKKYVTKSTAEKIHTHLMGLKAPERAQSSSDLYNLKADHPMTKHIQDDHRKAVQQGIKAPSEKKGRGRPKKS